MLLIFFFCSADTEKYNRRRKRNDIWFLFLDVILKNVKVKNDNQTSDVFLDIFFEYNFFTSDKIRISEFST